ncbi:MAG: nucleoside monophosphate kinase [Candidatus Competibacteraceae bacterium]|jgi:adenylate kinase|nr:nucleoside monophosphate kinase [Candidatus Competibacteraceae bacterium]
MSEQHTRLAIIMLGAPGSGKGTQGELLAQNTGFNRYVMSDMIKQELKPGTELYDKLFRQGILLSDTDVFEIFRQNFGSEDEVIIDGLPRTLDQAYWLYGFLMRGHYDIELIFLNVNEDHLIERITTRFYCPECLTLYNTKVKKPKNAGVCDHDGKELIQRQDDTPEVFKDRLATFREVRDVILDVYHGDVIQVNGDQEIGLANRELMKKIIMRA